MHEVGLVSAAIAQALHAASNAGASRVERLIFTLRPGGHVDRDVVRTLVAALGSGTPIEGASVEFEEPSGKSSSSELALTGVDVVV